MLTTAAMVRTGKVYGNLMVDVQRNSAKLRDRGRRIVVNRAAVADDYIAQAVLSQELAHYVLAHDAPLPGDSAEEMRHAYQERELDANAKSVEILERVGGLSEERALKTVYAYLLGVHWALERYPRLNLSGHKLPSNGTP